MSAPNHVPHRGLSRTARALPRLDVNGLYEVDGQTVRFEGRVEGGELKLRVLSTQLLLRVDRDDPHAALPTAGWLTEMIAAKRFRVGAGHVEIGPKASKFMMDEAEARALDPGCVIRMNILRDLDRLGEKVSDAQITTVIAKVVVLFPAEAAGFRGGIRAQTVRRWLKSRGSHLSRNWSDCVSNRGKGFRAHRLDPWSAEAVARSALWFWSSKLASKKDALAELARAVLVENDLRAALGRTDFVVMPARSTLERAIDLLATYETIAAKMGEKVARERTRAMGKAIIGLSILAIVQIDHTPLDVSVFDDIMEVDFGRATLTTIMCTFSRCIIGWFVGFEGPSVGAVMEALKHCLRPKIGCIGSDRYPILQDIFGKISESVHDNGLEFIGPSTQDALADLGITLTAVKVKSPDHKPFIERLFGTLNNMLVHKLPGTKLNVQKRAERQGEYQPDVSISIYRLQELIEETAFLYHISGHEGLGGQPPALVWQKDAARTGLPAFLELDRIDQLLAAVTTRTLSNDGIELHGLQYNHAPTTNAVLEWDKARRARTKRASLTVKVKYNPFDLGRIWIYSTARNAYFELPCVDRDYAEGLTLFQHRKIREELQREGLAFSSRGERLLAKAALAQRIVDLHPAAASKQRRTAARLTSKPGVRQALDRLGAYSVTGLPLLPIEPLEARRADEGVVPKGAARGAAKARRTREANAAWKQAQATRRTDDEASSKIDHQSQRRWDEDEWKGYQ